MSVLVSLLLTLHSWARSRAALQLELLALRHQLNVLPKKCCSCRGIAFMFVWYGMLWSVIEACTQERKIDLRGAFKADIDEVSPKLKKCRHRTADNLAAQALAGPIPEA